MGEILSSSCLVVTQISLLMWKIKSRGGLWFKVVFEMIKINNWIDLIWTKLIYKLNIIFGMNWFMNQFLYLEYII